MFLFPKVSFKINRLIYGNQLFMVKKTNLKQNGCYHCFIVVLLIYNAIVRVGSKQLRASQVYREKFQNLMKKLSFTSRSIPNKFLSNYCILNWRQYHISYLHWKKDLGPTNNWGLDQAHISMFSDIRSNTLGRQ